MLGASSENYLSISLQREIWDLRMSLGEMARDILIFPCQVMIIFSKINLDDNKNEF